MSSWLTEECHTLYVELVATSSMCGCHAQVKVTKLFTSDNTALHIDLFNLGQLFLPKFRTANSSPIE